VFAAYCVLAYACFVFLFVAVQCTLIVALLVCGSVFSWKWWSLLVVSAYLLGDDELALDGGCWQCLVLFDLWLSLSFFRHCCFFFAVLALCV